MRPTTSPSAKTWRRNSRFKQLAGRSSILWENHLHIICIYNAFSPFERMCACRTFGPFESVKCTSTGDLQMDAYRRLRNEWPQLLRQCRPFLPSKLLCKSSLARHHGGPRTVAKYNTELMLNLFKFMNRQRKQNS